MFNLNPLSWLEGPITKGVDIVQTHPTASFQIAVLVLLALVVIRLGRIVYLLDRARRSNTFWQNAQMRTRFGLANAGYGNINFAAQATGRYDLRNRSPFERARIGDYSQTPPQYRPSSEL